MVPERYKKYKTTLIGKHLADEYTTFFENNSIRNEKEIYFHTFTNIDKFWLLNITKLITENHGESYPPDVRKSIFFSLYFHKNKDMVVLKFPLKCSGWNLELDNNIRNYFSKILNKLGYSQYEFFSNKESIVKILISQDKTEDDLAKLLIISERFNTYVISNMITLWEDQKNITFNIEL